MDQPDKKVEEKTELARREFFKKVEKIKKGYGANPREFAQDAADRAASEYNKLFGRVGMHPMLYIKGGKKRPRFLLDREETLVVYKPALWQMGGHEEFWAKKVGERVNASANLRDAEAKMVESGEIECLQEWFGLMFGRKWVDPHKEPEGWGFVQRLDNDTDGPVVVGKTWRAQRCLQMQMREHVFNKGYICLVHGHLENKIHYVKQRFVEIGSQVSSQIMLEHTPTHDPFYDWFTQGIMPSRNMRMAETFAKPIAYYHRESDKTDYSLVYVNILSGITHQIRITMQSLGHPLVSDDRYLPRDEAIADLKWCPRNFLTEVRSDWFDMCGPHKDPKRKRFTRISIENPLPPLFQGILENKLTLTEKLDPTADLFTGCQYWALGDEQLMSAHPKDEDYRRKVMRWGQRKGIHLDTMDRLLLLPKEEIDEMLNSYEAPGAPDEACWVCPECMGFNCPDRKWKYRDDEEEKDPNLCLENVRVKRQTKKCSGKRRLYEDELHLPPGWMDYAADPTIQFLVQVNRRWLDARRKILKASRPSWERVPEEEHGTPCDGELRVNLEEVVALDAKRGGSGIREEDLAEMVPGCDKIALPLGEPPEDSKVRRVRLPGCGTGSQWVYCLKGKERAEILHKGGEKGEGYSCKHQVLREPIRVEADSFPKQRLIPPEERNKKARAEAFKEKRRKEKEEEEAKEKVKAEAALGEGGGATASSSGPAAKRRRTAGTWQRHESKSKPGNFYYHNAETGETRMDKPEGFDEAPPAGPAVWSRLESSSNPGNYYYHNEVTGETSVERPAGAAALKRDELKRDEETRPQDGIKWERRESSSRPGNFYYFNPVTGDNEIHPPRVDPPWKLLESNTKKGQYYYFNEETSRSSEHPPPCAKPAGKKAETGPAKAAAAAAAKPASGQDHKLPNGWQRKESDQFPGKFYFMNSATGETSWQRPVWERKESSSNPGKVYYVNVATGETSWTRPKTA